MYKKLILNVLAVNVFFASLYIIADEQKVINSGAEKGDLSGWEGFGRVNESDKHSGKFCFQVRGKKEIISSFFIPVKYDHPYFLHAWFKSFGEENSKVYLGFIPYDKNKKRIYSQYVNIVKNTVTEITADCNEGDTTLTVKDAKNWKSGGGYGVAFDVDSEKNNDLPNRKVIMWVDDVKQSENTWTISLKRKIPWNFKKGTKIRQHRYGPSAIYVASEFIPKEWKKCGGVINNLSPAGIIEEGKWWIGTKFAKILVLANHTQTIKEKLSVDDITIANNL